MKISLRLIPALFFAALTLCGQIGPAPGTPTGTIPAFSTTTGNLSITGLKWYPEGLTIGGDPLVMDGGIQVLNSLGLTTLTLDSSPGTKLLRRSVRVLTDGVSRWGIDVDPAKETGLNVGSYFGFNVYADDGNYLRSAIVMRRDNGNVLVASADAATRMAVGSPVADPLSRLMARGTEGRQAMKLIKDTATSTAHTMVLGLAKSTATVSNGFGPQMLFTYGAGTNPELRLAALRAQRDGGDTSSTISLVNWVNGAENVSLRLNGAGRVLLGSADDNGADPVQLNGETRVAGNFYVQRGTPASSTAACKADQMMMDSTYLYVCVADNVWKRAPMGAW